MPGAQGNGEWQEDCIQITKIKVVEDGMVSERGCGNMCIKILTLALCLLVLFLCRACTVSAKVISKPHENGLFTISWKKLKTHSTKHFTQILSLEMINSKYREIRDKYQRIGNESLHPGTRECLRETLLDVYSCCKLVQWKERNKRTPKLSKLCQGKICCVVINRQTLKRCWMAESFSAWPWLPYGDVQLEQSGRAGNKFTWVHGWVWRVQKSVLQLRNPEAKCAHLHNRHVRVSVNLHLPVIQRCDCL